MPIEYDVNKDGNVIRIKQVKGEEYTIKPQSPVTGWPATAKIDRWIAFKRMVAHQEPNVIVPYDGFPNKDELRRARQLFSKVEKDNFFKSALNGSKLTVKADFVTLTLYVKRETPKE